MKKKVVSLVSLRPIMVPNFILTENDEPISVTDFSEEELRELGAEFIEGLIQKRRKGISGPYNKEKERGKNASPLYQI